MWRIALTLAPISALTLALPTLAAAQEADKRLRLAVPPELVESGVIDYLVPRFSLKTATRIAVVGPGAEADARLGSDGRAAFEGMGQVWHLSVGADPDAEAFADWLFSEVGRNTLDSFAPDGETVFTSEVKKTVAVAKVSYDGDADEGAALALTHCGRCHVVGEINRRKSIGSTPSFAVLRTLGDWDSRFQAFYALNPHPAFTQIAEVTPEFDITRPSPIAPVEMTLDDLEDIMAYVAEIAPADLGAPIQSR